MQSAGMLSAGDLPCTNPAMGHLSFHRSPNGDQLAIWIFVLYFADSGKPCLGSSSHSPELGNARLVSVVILAYDYVPRSLVGNYVDRNRLDARQGFGIATTANIAANWRLRSTKRGAYIEDGGIVLCLH